MENMVNVRTFNLNLDNLPTVSMQILVDFD